MLFRTRLENALPNLRDDWVQKNFGKGNLRQNSAVLVLFQLGANEAEPDILMIRRSRNSLDPHGGQLAFPGGVLETRDKKSPISTALREADEEINLKANDVEIICTLQKFSTRFDVTIVPVLAVSKRKHLQRLQKNDEEIAEILLIKWDDIKKNRIKHERYGKYGWQSMPAYSCDAGFIWGASARMIAHLLNHLT